jgi:hypothetical protein
MRALVLNPPTFAFVVVTRAALAAGVGLLVSDRLPPARRRAIGGMLLAAGVATTIPAVMSVIRGFRRGSTRSRSPESVNYDPRLIGATRFPRKGDDLE